MAVVLKPLVVLALGGLLTTVSSASVSGAAHKLAPVEHATELPHVRSPYPLPARAVDPPPCTKLSPGPPPSPPPPPGVPNAAIPTVRQPAPRHVSLAALEGKGIWVTIFPGALPSAASLVSEARHAGLDALYVRTGSSTDGFYGGALLTKLVTLAHRYHLFVIAWDFPTLSNPAADAARAATAFSYGVDAFSPDIEEAADGTYLSARRVAYYLSLVRKDAGDRPVVATVPRPTSLSLAGYPYAAEAPFVDAFAPMVYWSCSEPGAAVGTAIVALRPLRPVVPVGQDYDMASEGGPVGLPSGAEVWRFVDVARRDGAIGVSLYDLESGGAVQLAALADYPWAEVASDRS